MNISREAKKVEAIHRMEMMDIFSETIKQFKEDNLVLISEPPLGAFFWTDDAEKKLVKQFEEEHNALVYMIIRTYTTMGRMDSLLFISDHQEEWEMDREDIENGIIFCYVKNYDAPECSEFGSIGYQKTVAGSIIRIS